MAIPVFVAAGTFQSGTAALTVPPPAGYLAGHLLLLLVESANQAIALPSGGWQEVTNSPQSTGTAAAAGGVRLAVFWKWAAGVEPSVSIADSGDHTTAVMLAVSGAGKIHLTAGNVLSSASTSLSWPSLTTTINDCLLILCGANDRDIASSANLTSQANSALSSVTKQVDQTVTSGAGGGLAVISGGLATAGAVGSTTATNGASVTFAYLTIAIEPEALVNNPENGWLWAFDEPAWNLSPFPSNYQQEVQAAALIVESADGFSSTATASPSSQAYELQWDWDPYLPPTVFPISSLASDLGAPTVDFALSEAPDGFAAAVSAALALSETLSEAPDGFASTATAGEVALALGDSWDWFSEAWTLGPWPTSLQNQDATIRTAALTLVEAPDGFASTSTATDAISFVLAEATDAFASNIIGDSQFFGEWPEEFFDLDELLIDDFVNESLNAVYLILAEAADAILATATGAIAANSTIAEAPDAFSAAATVELTQFFDGWYHDETFDLTDFQFNELVNNLSISIIDFSKIEAPDEFTSTLIADLVVVATIVEAPDAIASTVSGGSIVLVVTEASDSFVSSVAAVLVALETIAEAPDAFASTALSGSLTVSIVEASDGFASTTNAIETLSASIVETEEAFFATAVAIDTISAPIAEGADGFFAEAALIPFGTLNVNAVIAEAPDGFGATMATTGSLVEVFTEAADAFAASTTLALLAAATIVEAPDGFASSVSTNLLAAAAIVETPDFLSANALHVLSCSLNAIEAGDLFASATILEPPGTSSRRTVWIAPQDRTVYVTPASRRVN